MKKILLTKTLFTLVVLSIIVLLSSCTENYSTGERVGIATPESPQCKCQGKVVDTIYVVIDKTK